MNFDEILIKSGTLEAIAPRDRSQIQSPRPIGPSTADMERNAAQQTEQQQQQKRQAKAQLKAKMLDLDRALYLDTISKRRQSEAAQDALLIALRDQKPLETVLYKALETIAALTAEPVFLENGKRYLEKYSK